MASVTKTFKEDWYSNYKATWTLVLSGTDLSVTAVGQNLKYAHPTLTAKYVYSGKSYGTVMAIGIIYARYASANYRLGTIGKVKESSSGNMVKMTSGTTYTIGNCTMYTNGDVPVLNTVPASRFFDSNNPTVKAIDIIARGYQEDMTFTDPVFLESGTKSTAEKNNSTDKDNGYPDGSPNIYWGKIGTIYYRCPPTIGTPTVTKNTAGGYFKGKTTISVAITSTAHYGGYISKTKLTIGSQTKEITGNGTLSIALSTVGTFTPVLTVTDSRGQVATKNLAAITVQDYAAPTAVMEVERTDSAGAPADSGTSALLIADISYIKGAGNLVKPQVYIGSSSTEANVTWYTSRASNGIVSGAVDWTNYNPASPVRLYGLITDQFQPTSTYTIKLYPKDVYGSGNAVEKQLPSQFFPLDLYAGGEGVAIGQAAVRTGFDVNMETRFLQDVYIGSFKISDLIAGTYVHNGASTTSITFTDTKCIGRSRIICGAQDAGNPPLRAALNSTTGQITVTLGSAVTVMRVNYICW